MGQLQRVFDPQSIAVIGASNDPEKRGYRAMSDLVDSEYDGEVYPVNPNRERIFERTAHDTVLDIPGEVDLAFVAIPAAYVPNAIRECGQKDVAGAVINTAGFGEIGEDSLEEDLAAAAEEAGVRIIGPNIEGVDFAHQNVHLLGGIRTTPGHIGMLTQSGNMGHQLSVDAQDSGNVGFSYNIGVGNETDIGFHEYLSFLGDDDLTNGVVAYVEGMKDGRAFLREARRVSRKKPIVVHKSGRTSAGKGSAKSHTASIAGDVDVLESAYRQAGVQPVDSVDLLVPVAEALTNAPIPDGSRVAVLTDGGGHATATADALERKGLTLPDLSAETQATLEGIYELSPSLDNPVDVMGSADHEVMWYDTARYILKDPNVDALLIAGAALGYEECWDGKEGDRDPEIAHRLTALVGEIGKPVIFASMWEELGCSTALEHLAANGVPVYERIDTAVTALRALADYGTHLAAVDRKSDFVLGDDTNSDPTVETAVDGDRATFTEFEARKLLAGYGVPVVPFELAETAAEARTAAAQFDGPVAMKIVSRGIVHKTEAGGVELDVDGEGAVTDAFDRILTRANEYAPTAEIEGVLISPMVGDGVELIVGITDDPEVGPVLTCGLGGILVEALDDAAFRALPITEHDAREMLDDIGSQALLDGPRDLPPVDREELVDLIRSVSELVSENPAIRELDINPVIATSDGLSVVDASIELGEH
ncbi:MAG: acetate--CoA ligase family protein [Halobacteriota archaeon]|uniref:acetate--CoA ligase family protein n=1 Tax=Natronomonas sp. TaxID=2184060 RepID=UPI0039770902